MTTVGLILLLAFPWFFTLAMIAVFSPDTPIRLGPRLLAWLDSKGIRQEPEGVEYGGPWWY